MKRSPFPLLVILLTAVAALIGAGLRVYQLLSCTTENGLIVPGSRILYGMLGFAVLVLAAAAVLCSRLNSVRGTEASITGTPIHLFLQLAGAIAVFFGSLLRLLDGNTPWLCFGGMLAAGCLAAATLLYGKKQPVTVWLVLLPSVFLAVQLIFDFKSWSTDPLVLDFCFLLLAECCALLTLLHLSGFLLRVGGKRLTVFWAVGAVVFAAMSVPDYFLRRNVDSGRLLMICGFALLCAVHGLCLLRPAVQAEEPPAAPDDAAADRHDEPDAQEKDSEEAP